MKTLRILPFFILFSFVSTLFAQEDAVAVEEPSVIV